MSPYPLPAEQYAANTLSTAINFKSICYGILIELNANEFHVTPFTLPSNYIIHKSESEESLDLKSEEPPNNPPVSILYSFAFTNN